jgi:hypothetical protein
LTLHARAALTLLVCCIAGCGRTEARHRDQVHNCSAISLDGPGIARCLVAQYRWKVTDAALAGQARQKELDSIATHQRDSVWQVGAAKHRDQLSRCAAAGSDVESCLADTYGWDRNRATVAGDSVWGQRGAQHQQQVKDCQRRSKSSNIASCLMLSFQWDTKHALAAGDSVARARIREQNRPR